MKEITKTIDGNIVTVTIPKQIIKELLLDHLVGTSYGPNMEKLYGEIEFPGGFDMQLIWIER